MRRWGDGSRGAGDREVRNRNALRPLRLLYARCSLLLCLTSVLVITGCGRDDRARANPLDSRNPTTGGRPQSLRAVAGHQRVGLSWNQISVSFLAGFRLYRQEVGGELITTDISGSPHQFTDQEVENDRTYVYRLSALVGDNLDQVVVETPASDSVVVTPGPETCWVFDEGLGLLLKMAADARTVSSEVASIFGTRHMAVDPRDGAAWITTPFGGITQRGVAVRFSSDGKQSAVISGLVLPASVAVDSRDGSVWIADKGGAVNEPSAVIRASATGAQLLRLTGFSEPQGLAVDPATGRCWIGNAGSVVQVDPQGGIRSTTHSIQQPIALAVEPGTGACWGIDAGTQQVFRLRSDGVRTAVVHGLTKPVRLACSSTGEICWIVDQGGRTLIRLQTSAPDGYNILQRQDFHIAITGFFLPTDVGVDTRTDNVWVADAGQGAMAKLTYNGQLIRKFTRLLTPVAVAVDPGPVNP